ncbi:UDP-glycosyltransferase UGT5-like isoform X1 [Athalia rosae]|uniref:UDP-glycosyltransferase UGT5-like isoform X1 n=2 Tax=Athalia rosae TaxID=37344 RepID=UPI0020348BA8|nr:UDP-glycosyltransferase UGT5-like isoform X1 [Athalia rosae]
MKSLFKVNTVIALLCIFSDVAKAARILAVFPTPSISHQVVYRELTVELSKRGHEFVIFTTDPINDPSLKNYKEIDMHHTYSLMPDFVKTSETTFITDWWGTAESILEQFFSHPEMQRIIAPNNTEHFDLIMLEYMSWEATCALHDRLKAPIIGIISLQLFQWGHYGIGNPTALAYSPTVLDSFDYDVTSFWHRLRLLYEHSVQAFGHRFDNMPRQERLVKKYFGENVRDLQELNAELSLVISNTNPILGYPRPNLPIIIEVGGIHLKIKMKGFEKNVKKFLDSAVEGFVYFSLGSNVKSKHLPEHKLKTLMSVFASLPYKVLWKFELDTLPGKPDNVFISKWLPQHDVLAHPNIKVFVYQGGLQSTEEAITLGVPLVGVPVFGDQIFNVVKLVSVRIAKMVHFNSLPGEELRKAIVEVASDPSWKERVIKFRELLTDQPDTPLDRAVWWTEYVIRHKGAYHLRPKARFLSWYQREFLDVMAFVIAIVLLVVYLTVKIVRRLLAYICRKVCAKVKTN